MSAFHPVTGLALILLVSGSLLPGARDAAARSRETTVTTPRGTTTRDKTTQCADGSCTRNRSVTGPNGQTRTKTGTATKTGTGSATWSRQTTGPNGGTAHRRGRQRKSVGKGKRGSGSGK